MAVSPTSTLDKAVLTPDRWTMDYVNVLNLLYVRMHTCIQYGTRWVFVPTCVCVWIWCVVGSLVVLIVLMRKFGLLSGSRDAEHCNMFSSYGYWGQLYRR